jgi:DNA (cytosine-5)-methyltransferase 1
MVLTLGSLFDGIAGFPLAFSRAGVTTRWVCEIDASCRTVSARHFPEAEAFADVRECGAHNLAPVDIITGGFPCQDLSVAGRREGLAGDRSGLFFAIVRIVREMREATNGAFPGYVVLENVPGLLSSNGGRDFAVVLGELAQLGALDIGWRVLDAQYFGVAQRRRRVFIVVCFRAGSSAAEILSLASGGRRDSAPRRAAGEGAARGAAGGAGISFKRRGGFGWSESHGVSPTLESQGGTHQGGPENIPLVGELALSAQRVGQLAHREDVDTLIPTYVLELHDTLNAQYGKGIAGHNRERNDVALPQAIGFSHTQGLDAQPSASARPTLRAEGGGHGVLTPQMAVRRLTPLECERLTGVPDSWTAGHPDSTRYRMLGNSVAIPVVEWIARRLVAAAE